MAGRPSIPIDFDVLEAMMQYGATCLDCAGRFMCSEDTIQRAVKEHYEMNYAALSDKLMHKVRIKLRQKMFDSAMSGNTAIMIFLAKNWLAMKDRQDIDLTTKYKDITDEDLKKLTKEALIFIGEETK